MENYSKRELDEKFQEIKTQLDRIEHQTTKTNGNVTSLRVWRGYITGGLAILTIIVVPMAFWILDHIFMMAKQ